MSSLLWRESNSIAMSIRNKDDPAKVDVYLARSLELYVSQTIQRIMSIYGTVPGGDNKELYQIGVQQHSCLPWILARKRAM